MQILRVGDPHSMVSNIKECEKLMHFIVDTAKQRDINIVEFLGDLFHTHAVKRIEVEHFWMWAFDFLEKAKIECRVLTGNHDQIGSREKEQTTNSLNVFARKTPAENGGKLYIVNKPMVIGGIAYVPYYSDHEQFLKATQELYDQGATQLLVAHQTFTGAQYENGFFSEEGIDPALVPQTQIVSGHIHATQQVGKCFYPGTPKWDNMSDANQPKGIWIFTHDSSGLYIDKEFISTENVVSPIVSYEVKEGEELPDLNPKARNYVTLEGKSAWINNVKKKIKDLAHIKVKPTDRVVRVNRDSSFSIEKYLESEFEPIAGITKQQLADFLRDL